MILAIITCALFLGFLMTALFNSAKLGSTASAQGIIDRQARYAAYAGIQRSFLELNRDPTWRAGWSEPQPLVQNPQFAYTVDADDVPLGLGADEVYLFAEGYPGTEEGATAIAAYAGTAYRPSKVFTEAGFGKSSILMSGSSVTDAFDSSSAGYSAGSATEEGSVASTESVAIDGAEVKGDVILAKAQVNATTDPTAPPPPSAAAQLTLINGGSYTGDELEPAEPRVSAEFVKPYDETPDTVITDVETLLPTDAPADAIPTLAPGSYKSITVEPGKKLQLTEGEYYISDLLALEDAELVVPDDDEVKVFIGKDMTVVNSKLNEPLTDSDGSLNNTRRPAELCLFFLDEGVDPDTEETVPSTFLSKDGILNCAIAGGGLRADLDGSTLYGAVSGNAVRLRNSTLHYDKSLQDNDFSSYTGWRLKGLSAEKPRP